MVAHLTDAAFCEFLDDFVRSAQIAVPLGSNLDAYFPTLCLHEPDEIKIAVLAGEDGQHLESHDMLLQMMCDFGEQHCAEMKRWPQAVGVAYRDENGLTIWAALKMATQPWQFWTTAAMQFRFNAMYSIQQLQEVMALHATPPRGFMPAVRSRRSCWPEIARFQHSLEFITAISTSL